VSRLLVRRLHAAGAGIWVWTVDRPSEITRLRALAVDGICSDDPASHSWEEQVAEQIADADGAGET
jgi:glycerophosphoryl diester phosphodiesterase